MSVGQKDVLIMEMPSLLEPPAGNNWNDRHHNQLPFHCLSLPVAITSL